MHRPAGWGFARERCIAGLNPQDVAEQSSSRQIKTIKATTGKLPCPLTLAGVLEAKRSFSRSAASTDIWRSTGCSERRK